MKQVDTITTTELSEMAQRMYGNLVKGVVDLKKNILVVDVEMHVDINIRPRQNNMSRGVDDEATRAKIISIVNPKIAG